MSGHDDQIYDPAGPIIHKDPLKRLDRIIRRLGGEPRPISAPKKPVLPTPGRRSCEGQLALDGEEPES